MAFPMDRLSRLSDSSNMGSCSHVYHDTKTHLVNMVDGLAVLDSILGKSLFEQEAHITLTRSRRWLHIAEHMKETMVPEGHESSCATLCSPGEGSLENMHVVRYMYYLTE